MPCGASSSTLGESLSDFSLLLTLGLVRLDLLLVANSCGYWGLVDDHLWHWTKVFLVLVLLSGWILVASQWGLGVGDMG